MGFVRRGRPNGVDRMVPWTKPRFRHLAASQDREDPFSHMAGGPDLSACPEGSLNAKGPWLGAHTGIERTPSWRAL